MDECESLLRDVDGDVQGGSGNTEEDNRDGERGEVGARVAGEEHDVTGTIVGGLMVADRVREAEG